ncbi:type II toxin-antitoxin system RelE/ParE family toxin [Paraburkholderia sp. BCC1885]|jgi:phage-related protein|uniref:type II toxin-antitoxin system RelE/ParE family toxin n=1 Tax=Paraburkholderia sp. BCC1885 TaxID=2562669 RepID=UPI00118254B7|nr:type II toxin-antitoxin system RelE/ParE family toxin [Paraburkholderia sp. BCC1885]
MEYEKDICWVGSSYKDLLAFPEEPRRQAGFQLSKIQAGLDPDDWKSFPTVGSGTREIRLNDTSGAYRVMYVAKLEHAIYVLHCFHKKTQVTSRHDVQIGKARYRAVVNHNEA